MSQPALYQWNLRCSLTVQDGTRIACKSWTVGVIADSEDEARRIALEDEPGCVVNQAERGDLVDPGEPA